MASATIHGKFDLDLRGKKVEGLAEATVNGDAVRLEQFGGSNIWQESAQLSYNSGQRVSDFVVQFQGRVTTGVVESIGGANIYDFDFDVFEKPTDETDQVYFQRFSINPVSGVEIIQVIDVQRNTPNTGQTRITLQPPINSNFTLTYPPTNFGASVGAAVREYTRRPIGLHPAPTNPTPAEKLELRPSTAVFALDASLGSYVSDYWILELINGTMWRPFQTYVEGDEVEYMDSQGVARHVLCQEAHTSSEATNPILSSSISHTGTGFSADVTPWAPVGGAVDLSTGTFEAAVQILGSDGNAAIALNGGSVLNEDRWFINVGQGTSAIELPDAQLPAVGDLISFGIGNAGTTQEYRVAARNDDGNTSLRFDGTYPDEVETLVDDRVDNPVNLFNAGLRTDFGQVDRFVFDPEDFSINTEAQNIGHAHISISGGLGANQIAGQTIERNAAEQTVEQWIASSTPGDPRTAGNFVAVEANALNFLSLARNNQLFTNPNHQVEIATYQNGDYHRDLLYYEEVGGRMVLHTDNLQSDLDSKIGEANATLVIEGVSISENSGFNEIDFTSNANLRDFIDSIGFPAGAQATHVLAAGTSINISITDSSGTTTDFSLGQVSSTTTFNYVYGSSTAITFDLAAANFSTARTGTLRYADATASVNNISAGTNIVLTRKGDELIINSEGGGSVEVNGTAVTDADFRSHPEAATYLYSPPFQSDANTTTGDTDVSVQVDTREIGNALGIDSLQAQVHQIEEELSQPGSYTWVDEQVFVDVFITNRVNSSGTLNQATILQPHFVDNSNIFTTYALLTGDDDTGLRNQWNGFNSNAAGIIVGIGPDDTDLVAFQLLSTYYRDSTAAGLAEIRLKMIDPDGAFEGPSRVGTNSNKQQFISWISDNDNPITPTDPNPVVHQGISTYYYETDNDFLDTVRHNVGSHITGSALTADERVIVDNLAGITMPGGDNVITLGQYDSGGGGIETKGDWYWRNAQSGPAQVTFSSTPVWSDLVNTSAANPTELHVLMLEAETGDEDKLNAIRTTIGVRRGNGDTTQLEDNELGLLYVAHDNLNWAILEVASSPADTGNNDVRFWINRVVESQGAPKTAATNPNTLSITISDVGVTVGAYVGDLTVDGDLDVTKTVNGADANAVAYVAIQLSAGVPTTITPTGAVTGHVYLQYTARYNGTSAILVDDINTAADPVTATTYINFVDVANPGTEIPQQ